MLSGRHPPLRLQAALTSRGVSSTLIDRHRLFEILLHIGFVVSGEEKWVDVEVVAKHLGVRKESIYRWIDRRGFPAHRVGRLLRFRLSEVDEWVRTSRSAMGDRAGRSPNEANDAQRGEERTQ